MTNTKLIHDFVAHWTGKGYEKGESQPFWIALLHALGIEEPTTFITFEQQVHIDHTAFIDGFIPATKVLIEQKSIQKDLGAPIKQSDGSLLNPFQQAKRYAAELPYSSRPRWIVTSNFREFWIYDMEQPNSEPQVVLLENLEKEHYRLRFLVDTGSEALQKEMQLSIQAGDLVGKIYDAIRPQYAHPDDPDTLASLNQLCVRLVFCLFAEDAGLFGDKNEFHDYLNQFPAPHLRRALIDLFRVLDTKPEDRDPYLDDDLRRFPYVNGGLFSNENIEIPQLTDEIRTLLLTKASEDFDWSEISPTIFGAVFESTLNPDTRRSGGMHYTSIENIHKVIDPLFLNDLQHELGSIANDKTHNSKFIIQNLHAFQDKLASLTFFDPACGSGNFLTETYISLRRLENKVIRLLQGDQMQLGTFTNPIRVDIHQFYGIEINDFAVSVATTALWIAELQMLRETERICQIEAKPLPLHAYHNIHEGNALRTDWSRVVPTDRLNYIMGNPPFVGYSLQNKEQKEDILSILVDENGKPYKTAGKVDYVAGWYYKATEMMVANPAVRTALVSTNSITQGEQVAGIWKPLFERYGVHIDFAYPTFRWDSESSLKAHVHCVIIGFSISPNNEPKRLYFTDGTYKQCENISAYLVNAKSTIFVENRYSPICDVPILLNGGKPTEGGFLIMSAEEKEELIQENPIAEQWIRPYMMGKDFIDRKTRFCLWLVNANPAEVRKCKKVMERIEAVRNYRLQSPKEATRKKADTPMLFDEVRECTSDYVAIPKVSSERRRYIPMEYLSKSIIPGDKLFMLPNATLYHFGVLTSNVHMAWMRAVCGRLKSDYSYSNTIVYNNFPWPQVTPGTRTPSSADGLEQTTGLYNASVSAGITAGGAPASPAVASSAVTAPAVLHDHCRKYLPHIEGKALQSVTFRLYDSLPKEVIQQWKNLLDNAKETQETIRLRTRIEQYEDTGYGQCFLKDPRVAQIVQDTLEFGDGAQYNLLRWCIMPNHVHVLIEVLPDNSLSTILQSWKSVSAHKANKVLNRTGAFWMDEYFDRYIRTTEHLHDILEYIDYNPVRAGLSETPAQYPYCSAFVEDAAPETLLPGTRTPSSADGLVQTTGLYNASVSAGVTAGEAPASPAVVPSAVSPMVAAIERTAQAILDARAKYPDCSLADLYDEVTMPIELRRAHQANDRAVMAAYGFPTIMSESDCVARLLEMYQQLTGK